MAESAFVSLLVTLPEFRFPPSIELSSVALVIVTKIPACILPSSLDSKLIVSGSLAQLSAPLGQRNRVRCHQACCVRPKSYQNEKQADASNCLLNMSQICSPSPTPFDGARGWDCTLIYGPSVMLEILSPMELSLASKVRFGNLSRLLAWLPPPTVPTGQFLKEIFKARRRLKPA